MTTSVLAVGIEPILLQFLTEQGFSVTKLRGASTESLCAALSTITFDALLLGHDTNLGAHSVAYIRKRGYGIAILCIQNGPRSTNWSHSCVEFLEAGGDNVILGPANPEEVSRCIALAVSHSTLPASAVHRYQVDGDTLYINIRRMRVLVNDSEVQLTRSELKLLTILVQYERALRIKDIIENLYETDFRENWMNTACVFICRLRKKIGKHFISFDSDTGYCLIGKIQY